MMLARSQPTIGRIDRVALVAGGLSQGGAEKQFVYMARALQQRGIDVRCYCLTRGEFYEQALRTSMIEPVWFGAFDPPPVRVVALARRLRAFAPQVVQAGHFFANLYAALAARVCGAVSIGAIRNDGRFELTEHPGWGPWLMRLPTFIIANSHAGERHALANGRTPDDVAVVPNVIDLAQFDAGSSDVNLRAGGGGPVAMAVGRLVRAKRFADFLGAVAHARGHVPGLQGVIVGDGPERAALEREAARLNLTDAVRFLGRRADVAALMRQADFLVSSSEHEGFPNVVLEAMAARLPVITTPAGDAASVILPGATGMVVEVGNVAQMADAITLLSLDAARRSQMGLAGRKRAERLYADDRLADRLLAVYERARLRARPAASPGRREREPHGVGVTTR